MIEIRELPPRLEHLRPEQTSEIFGGCTTEGHYCMDVCECCDDECSAESLCVKY